MQEDRLLPRDLARALDRDELRLLFQPIVSTVDGATVGVEALIRWQHPSFGLVGPDRFIATAEASGLIVPIGEWVVEEACRVASAWGRISPHLETAVNVSVRQLDARFVSHVERTIRDSRIGRGALAFEITETLPPDDLDALADSVAALRDLGCRVGLDDFGTGYAGLAHLDHLPVDFIKLDRRLVATVGASGRGGRGRLLGAVVAMARVLVLDVVAEGVETAEELERVRALGLRRAQGFHFSRPVPAADLSARLALAA